MGSKYEKFVAKNEAKHGNFSAKLAKVKVQLRGFLINANFFHAQERGIKNPLCR